MPIAAAPRRPLSLPRAGEGDHARRAPSSAAARLGEAFGGVALACGVAEPLPARRPLMSDRDLVQRARGGDREAFDLLVLRYKDRIYNLCYSKLGSVDDALDACQEVFLRAYRAIDRFRGSSRFYTWLFRIALNCSFTQRKRRSAAQALAGASLDQASARSAGSGAALDDDGIDLADPSDGPGVLAQRAEQLRAIHDAIGELPDDFQEIVLLRDIQGLAYEDIASMLDMPIGSVKSRLHRARVQLRAKLGPCLEER